MWLYPVVAVLVLIGFLGNVLAPELGDLWRRWRER